LFEKYAKLAAKCANDFADFQSPRMGTVQVRGGLRSSAAKKKFTIAIFDHRGRKVLRYINVKPALKSATSLVPSPDNA
jgi:hypothetical protein